MAQKKRIFQRLWAAEQRCTASQKHFEALMRLAYPVGARVVWIRGPGSPHTGQVVMWGGLDRVKVFNGRTGNERWITFDQIDY